MSVELIVTEDGDRWLIEGTPGNYRLLQVDVVEVATDDAKHRLRRAVHAGLIERRPS